MHFKELFALDGKETNLSENDIARRNTIANLLSDWGLVEVKGDSTPTAPLSLIKNNLKRKMNGYLKRNIT